MEAWNSSKDTVNRQWQQLFKFNHNPDNNENNEWNWTEWNHSDRYVTWWNGEINSERIHGSEGRAPDFETICSRAVSGHVSHSGFWNDFNSACRISESGILSWFVKQRIPRLFSGTEFPDRFVSNKLFLPDRRVEPVVTNVYINRFYRMYFVLVLIALIVLFYEIVHSILNENDYQWSGQYQKSMIMVRGNHFIYFYSDE